MKILMVFLDMLRINLTNVYDIKNKETLFDKALKKIGGMLFTNCYTNAPDTPRSFSCLWSSLYPKENGCDNRLKYPYYYLEKESFLNKLENGGYQINIFSNQWSFEIGEFPRLNNENSSYSKIESIKDFLLGLKPSENSLTFLGFEDYHHIISDCFARKKYVKKAFDISGKILETIGNHINFDDFDLTIFYSDHGFKTREESFDTNYKMLDSPRTQILLFIHKKGDVGITRNNKFSSIFDIYPTVLDVCRIQYNKKSIRGISLYSKQEHDFFMIEDPKSFGVGLGQTIETWGIRTKDGLFVIDSNLKWEGSRELSEQEQSFYLDYIKNNGTDFSENVKMQTIHNKYNYALEDIKYLFDGTKRKTHKPLSIKIKDGFKKMVSLFGRLFKKIGL